MKQAFRLAYDGRHFYGFQRQSHLPTVEKSLFKSLVNLGLCSDVPVDYSAAGRTDSGVSAIAQTVSFEAPIWCTPSAINSKLPSSIRVWASTTVPENFNATLDALNRTYVYYLDASNLDYELLNSSIQLLSGLHDFHNLTPDKQRTKRNITISATPFENHFIISIESSGFSRELVRRIISLIVEISSKKSPIEKIDRIFSPHPLTGPEGVPPAPAYPLILYDVDYPYEFQCDPKAIDSARDIFETLSKKHLTLSHIFQHIPQFLI